MRLSFYHILSAFAFLMCAFACTTATYAQDGGFPLNETYDSDPDYSDLPAPSGEGEARLNTPKIIPASVTPTRDSAAVRVPAQRHLKSADKAAESSKNGAKNRENRKQPEDDDSVLSFNFLYYIFQKYKLQDIVD
ncbi:MAG TPA: hypothetical protein VD816_09115 [Ohtaekwangia sp.]|nr:hypothetical protein [Ohtaekwangia sp.]